MKTGPIAEKRGGAWLAGAGLRRMGARGLIAAGIALDGGRIFVSESASGDIVAFDMEGTELGRVHTPAERIMGITFGPDGRLWYADPGADEIVRIDP